MTDRLLQEFAFALYGFSNFAFLLQLRSPKGRFSLWGNRFVFLGVAVHLASYVLQGIILSRFPILRAEDALGLLAILILFVYVAVQWKSPLPGLGFLATSLAFLFTLTSFVYPGHTAGATPNSPTGAALEIHVAAIILGFGILALAFCSSVAYLAQDFMLHGKRMIILSKRLPPLDTLDLLTNRLVAGGFVSLSVGILFGSLWAERQWGHWWSWDPKLVLAVLTWCIYAIYIYSRTLSGWKGRRSVMLIIIGFLLIMVTFLGTNFFPGRHRFV